MKDWSKKFIATELAIGISIVLSVALMRVFDLLTGTNLMILAWCYFALCLCLFVSMTQERTMKIEILGKQVILSPSLGNVTVLIVGVNEKRFRAYYDIEVEPKTREVVSIAVSLDPLEPVKLHELRIPK